MGDQTIQKYNFGMLKVDLSGGTIIIELLIYK